MGNIKPSAKHKLNNPKANKAKDLDLSSSSLKTLPTKLEEFKNLKVLNLYNNHLSELSDVILKIPSLQNIVLSKNNFKIFPDKLLQLSNIRSINLNSNQLRYVKSIEGLSNSIEKLDLSNNELDILRTDFSGFSKLRVVKLDNNRISNFPKSIISESIKELSLSYNEIEKLPIEIGKLKSLRSLDLSFNNIKELPEEIGELKELRYLNLTGNQIQSVPRSFKNLTKLTDLKLAQNPLGRPPLEISSQGVKAVLHYYLNLGRSVKLREAKLLIVGQGAVGKTYLMNRLINNETPETETTQGIDIMKWVVTDSSGEAIRLNTWDFGGQEIYHSTHQFFLTKRSIYILVWEARKDEPLIYFDYWLNIINILSGKSPIILVMNKCDERTKQIDESTLREQFSNINHFISVSAKTGENIPNLRSLITECVSKLTHINDKLPEIWSQIREKLESLDNNYIEYEEYKKICHEFGIDSGQIKILSKYLHDIGVFLHFKDNTLLSTVIFLKPEWVTNSVYEILDMKDVINNNGKFKHSLLTTKMTHISSRNITLLLELMKKFELCYEVNEGEYIVPELLSPTELPLKYDFKNSLGMTYKYDFMPAGIVTRLAVRLKEYLSLNETWKYGALFKLKGSVALVKSNPYRREIYIQVKGELQAKLLDQIKWNIDLINISLNNPSHQVLVACNCNECKKTTDKYMFDWDFLQRAVSKKVNTVTCQNSIDEVHLSGLIGPYEMKHGTVQDSFSLTQEDLFYAFESIITLYLNRKATTYKEDNINDLFVDGLRLKDFEVSDQSRGGISGSGDEAGELDIIVNNERHVPISIVEALRLKSLGRGNTTIIQHLNKLILRYDAIGLPRNYLLVYCESNDFHQTWVNYQDYIDNLKHHRMYDVGINFESSEVKPSLNKNLNYKVLISYHNFNGEYKELYHILINIKK